MWSREPGLQPTVTGKGLSSLGSLCQVWTGEIPELSSDHSDRGSKDWNMGKLRSSDLLELSELGVAVVIQMKSPWGRWVSRKENMKSLGVTLPAGAERPSSSQPGRGSWSSGWPRVTPSSVRFMGNE